MTKNDMKHAAEKIATSAMWAALGRLMMVFGVPVAISMGGWVLLNTIDIQVRLGKLEQKSLDAGVDRYHATDATRDFALRDIRIDRNTEDISKLDGRISYIERNGFRMIPHIIP